MRRINNVSEKIKAELQQVEDFVIVEMTLYDAIRKCKNWSAPGVDGVQIFFGGRSLEGHGNH